MFNKCEYIISAVSKKQFPNKTGLNEYVFLGRSNVGKSSLINAITNRKLLAHTSSKPGKTQAINFYLIDEKLYFVDVPGYGYASQSVSKRLDFGKYIESYLKNNPNLKIAFLLVDTKVGPTNDDILMYEYLKYLNINTTIIATKADKVGTTHLQKHIRNIKEKLGDDNLIITSSLRKQGIDKIIKLID
ncbi:MAG TPA: YihA family ribosome biogenesis GTP-binding protein [Acholeplasmataceae bacterium]|nr:YihA family ribosome biogenesis GTP-binding protein [Acholeplasmataceae bacterium]